MPFYNHAIAPIWDRVSIYEDGTAFLRQFALVTEEQGPGTRKFGEQADRFVRAHLALFFRN
jgi:hypothetical protein